RNQGTERSVPWNSTFDSPSSLLQDDVRGVRHTVGRRLNAACSRRVKVDDHALIGAELTLAANAQVGRSGMRNVLIVDASNTACAHRTLLKERVAALRAVLNAKHRVCDVLATLAERTGVQFIESRGIPDLRANRLVGSLTGVDGAHAAGCAG